MVNKAELAKLQGRLNAVEGLLLMFSGIVLTQAPNDPDHTKAIAIMDAVRDGVVARGRQTGAEPESAAAADELLSLISENLGLIRGRL